MRFIGTLQLIILAAALAFVPGVVSAETSTNVAQPSTGAASTTVADTVKQAIASEDLHHAALARLEQTGQWRGLSERVAALEEKFDALSAGAANRPELINSIELDRHLRGLHREAGHSSKTLPASSGAWNTMATCSKRARGIGRSGHSFWRVRSFPRRSGARTHRSRPSLNTRMRVFGSFATKCCSSWTARWFCKPVSKMRGR